MIMAAASLWGSIGIFIKNLTAAGFSPMQLVAFRTLISMTLIFLFLLWKAPEKLKIRWQDSWMFIGTGLFSFVFFNYFYFISVQRNGLSVASVLLYTAPVFVFLLSVLLFRERVTPLKVTTLILAVIGCLLVSGALEKDTGMLDLFGILAGVLSGLGYGLYSIFGKFALTRYDAVTITFYTFLFGTLGAFPLAGMNRVPGLIDSFGLLANILILAVLITILPFTLYTMGLSGTEPSKASVLATVEPLVATFFGLLLYQESLGVLKFFGILAVIGAALIINLQPKERRLDHV
jgi:drug/metabolite transporter (DMT)-like permease